MLEWKAVWEPQHHRPFGVSYAVFSSSTLTRFLGAVLPKGCWDSATSKLSCRWWHFWVPCWSAGKGNATTPRKVAKLGEGPAANPGSLHLHSFVRASLNSESELYPTLHWKLKEKTRTRHSFLIGLRKAEQPDLRYFYMCCWLTWSYCDSLDILFLLQPRSLGDRSIQECPLSKQDAEKLFPIID